MMSRLVVRIAGRLNDGANPVRSPPSVDKNHSTSSPRSFASSSSSFLVLNCFRSDENQHQCMRGWAGKKNDVNQKRRRKNNKK